MTKNTKTSFDWDKKGIEKQERGFEHAAEDTQRRITYVAALHETFDQLLAEHKEVFIMGQGVDDPFGMFGATLNLHKKHGHDRVFDTPLSEEGVMGIAMGAALGGMRPIYMHNRPDFLLLAMNQIVNHIAKWSYMFGGAVSVPVVIWACVGRGWGSGAQHSQALHGLFMHVPGLKLVLPSTPYDAKGLLVSSVSDNNPVIILEHRWSLNHTGHVPEGLYAVPFGKGVIRSSGKDVTIVGISYMCVEAQRAAEELKKIGISAEVIDPRTLKPLDEEIILNSVRKTGRLIVADIGWQTAGAGAEIAALVCEKAFKYLRRPVKRIASPDVPTPAGYVLERKFYAGSNEILKAAVVLMRRR